MYTRNTHVHTDTRDTNTHVHRDTHTHNKPTPRGRTRVGREPGWDVGTRTVVHRNRTRSPPLSTEDGSTTTAGGRKGPDTLPSESRRVLSLLPSRGVCPVSVARISSGNRDRPARQWYRGLCQCGPSVVQSLSKNGVCVAETWRLSPGVRDRDDDGGPKRSDTGSTRLEDLIVGPTRQSGARGRALVTDGAGKQETGGSGPDWG